MAALRFAFVSVLVVLSGCAAQKSKFGDLQVEEISVEEQARQEVLSTPTTFLIPHDRDNAAWQRARSFFQLYLPQMQQGGEVLDGENMITNTGVRGGFVYEVERGPAQGGLEYSVSCRPADRIGDPIAASNNAKNVARFIKEGTLERSLLNR